MRPGAVRDETRKPQVRVPQAAPAAPRSVYQAKMSARMEEWLRCARVDSSMARKGPISLPLGGLVGEFAVGGGGVELWEGEEGWCTLGL